MPTYRYEPIATPAAESIGALLARQGPEMAALMARRGDIEAQRALAIGNTQAQAAQARGQAWGGAAQSIGQTLAAIPQQMQQQKRAGLQDQALTLQVDAAKRQQAGEQTMAGLMATPQGPTESGAPLTNSYLTSEGLWDVPKLTAALGSSGMGDQAASLLKGAESINDSILKHQDYQQKAAAQHTILLGDLADGALKLAKSGMPLDQAMDFVVQPALATKRISPQEYAQVKQQLAQLPPDQQQQALTTLMDQAAKLGGDKDLAKDAQRLDRYGRPIASNIVPEKPTKASLAADSVDPTKTPEQRTAAKAALDAIDAPNEETVRHNKELERIAGLTAGRSEATQAETARHNRVMEGQGAAALSEPAMQQAARKYLDSGVLPPGMGKAGVAQRTAIMNLAAQIDPTAALARNAATFKADSANLTNLTKTEGTLSAFEKTAGKNLDQFLTLADKIPDTGVPWANTPVRLLNKQLVGSANMAAIDAARDVALREIARVTNDPKLSGALTDSARAEVLGLSPQNATLKQIKAVAKVLKTDMANVHSGINEQIATVKAGMGSTPGQQTTPGTIRAKDPQGNIHEAPAGTALPSGWVLQ